jgi:hypothetical protein
MKLKPKHAFAALAIALAGQAGAQVLTANAASGNSSVYFMAVDDVAGRSYFSEMVANAGSTTLGVLHMDDLISNASSPTAHWTFTLSSLNTLTTLSPSVNFRAGFGAADTNNTLGGGGSIPTGSRRILASSSTDNSGPPAYTNGIVGLSSTGAGFNMDAYNTQLTGTCSSSPCATTDTTSPAYGAVGNGRAIGVTWGIPNGTSIGDSLQGTIAWDIFVAATNSTTQGAASTVTQLALRAVLDLATNTLTIASTSAVPVPAAVWLLGSALLGFVGIGRRKKGQLAADGAVAA